MKEDRINLMWGFGAALVLFLAMANGGLTLTGGFSHRLETIHLDFLLINSLPHGCLFAFLLRLRLAA